MTTTLVMVGFAELPDVVARPAQRTASRFRWPRAWSWAPARRRPTRWPRPADRARRAGRKVQEGPSDPATVSAVALAVAVRQQLTHPGSVSPQRQLELILADRLVDAAGPSGTSRAGPGWTPFLVRVDASPYRPLADGAWTYSPPVRSP